MSIQDELQFIYENDPDRILHPEAVVEFAEDREDSALHPRFDWDNEVAGPKWRIEQAKHIIRVAKIRMPDDDGENEIRVRAFHSLYSDRHGESKGYRATVDIMREPERVDEMLQVALGELRAFRTKYAHLKELKPLMAAIAQVEQRSVFSFNLPAIAESVAAD